MHKVMLPTDLGRLQRPWKVADDAHCATIGTAALTTIRRLARCRKMLTIPTVRPVRCAEQRADDALDGRVDLGGDLRERLEIQFAHLDHETANAGLTPLFVLPLTRKAGFRLAGWPLPGGSRTLSITAKGFGSYGHP